MDDLASASGAFSRPTLLDYLLVAEQEKRRVALVVHLGRLELGLIGIETGKVVHAELPGSQGDTALALLTQMPGTRVVPGTWATRPPNVSRSWRDLVDKKALESSPGRAWRLDAVRAELGEISEPDHGASEEQHREHNPLLVQILGELLDWAAASACLQDDVQQAHVLLTRRDELCPAELICASNLERLHLRLLADDIVASVAEDS